METIKEKISSITSLDITGFQKKKMYIYLFKYSEPLPTNFPGPVG